MTAQITTPSRTRGRILAWFLLIIVLASTILFGAGRAVALGKRIGRSAGLGVVPVVKSDATALAATTWRGDDPDGGRTMEPATRTEIANDYTRAWRDFSLAYQAGGDRDLRTYFAGPALDAVTEATGALAARGWQVAQGDTAHTLQLHFYSADGSIVAFTDSDALVARIVRDEHGAVVLADEARETYDVVMFLDDGNWRVRQWLKTASVPVDPLVPAQSTAAQVGRDGVGLTLQGQPYRLAGINYYPQGQPWHAFWPSYDGALIDRDFQAINGLGLNTVRVFVPFLGFGGVTPDPVMLDRLDDLLTRANAHGLKVIVTLFDFRADYEPTRWAESDRQLNALIPRFAANPTILAWDVKNEPDLDYQRQGRDNVDLWLAHTLRVVRGLDPHHLLTIGWSNPQSAQSLATSVDLVSFHYYAPTDGFSAAYGALRAAAPGRPIALTEFGLSTWNSPFFPGGHTETEQAATIATVRRALGQTDSVGYLAWTLYDFSNVPVDVAGDEPWRRGPQSNYGVVRADGTPKRAAALLAPNADLAVQPVAAWERVLKPFTIVLGGVLATLAILALVALRAIGRRATGQRVGARASGG